MPEFFDKQAGKVVQGTAEEAQQAYLQGRAGFRGRVNVLGPDGQLSNVPAESLGEALTSGYQIAQDDAVHAAKLQAKYGEDTVQAAGEGLARGVTFGLSDVALTETGLVDPEDLSGRQAANPTAATVGEVAGAVLPALATGGGSAAASGAAAATRLGQAAQVAGRVARATPAGALARGAARVEGAVRGMTGSRAAALAASGGVEGAIVGAGQAVSAAAMDDVELTAEQLLAGAGEGALLGGLAGGALGAGTTAAQKTVEKAYDVVGERAQQWLGTLPGSAAFRAVKGPGGGKSWVEQAEALGGHGKVGEVALERGLVRPGDNVEKIAPRLQQEAAQLRDEFFAVAKHAAPETVEDAYDEAAVSILPKKLIRQADRFHGGRLKVARRVRELGVVEEGSDYATIHETASRLAKETGEDIGAAIRRIDEAGVDGPTNEVTHERLVDMLAGLKRSGSRSQKQLAERVRKELESRGFIRQAVPVRKTTGKAAQFGAVPDAAPKHITVMELEPPRRFTWQEYHAARRSLQQEMARFDQATSAAVTDAYRKASGIVEDNLERMVDAVAPQLDDDLVRSYKRLKEDFSTIKLYQDAALEKIQAAAAKDNVDLGKEIRSAFDKAHQVVTEKFDEAVSKSANADELRKLRFDYQAIDLMRQAVDDAVNRSGANRNLSLSDTLGGMVGGDLGGEVAETVLGDILGGVGGFVGGGVLVNQIRTRGAATVAAATNAARQVTQRVLKVERATDDAVRAFFERGKQAVKRGAPRAAAQQAKPQRERYQETVQELGQATSDTIIERTAQRMQHSDMPALTEAYALKALQGAEFLRSKLPPDRTPSASLRPDLDKKQRVTDSEMRKFLRYADAVKDPMTVIRGMEDGTITREGVEALKEVYPRMYATLVDRVLGQVEGMDEDLSYERKRQLSIVLRTPLHPSLTGEFIAFAQSRYAPQAQQQQDPGAGLLAPSRRSAPELSARLATNTQQLEIDEASHARS